MAIPVIIVDGTIETVVNVGDIDFISQVNEVINIQTLDQVNDVTNVATVNLVNEITNVATVASVTNVVAVATVSEVTNVATVASVTNVVAVATVSEVTNVATVASVTNVVAVDSVSEIVKESVNTLAFATANTGAANTAVQLANMTANKFVIIRSLESNNTVQPIWVGESNVDAANSANGYPLDAGESIKLPIENANMVYLDSQVANQDYSLVVV